jgi:4'-phosphopantetheinyl transferase
MIHVLFTCFDSEIPDERREYYLRKMPESIRDKINRYVRWQDRQAGLFGKLLLLKGLTEYGGYFPDCLNSLSYNDFGRPFIDSDIDFNISHSGDYVVCAVGTRRQRVFNDMERTDWEMSDDGERHIPADRERTRRRRVPTDERVGIDIEKIRPIVLSDFKNYMTSREWEDIAASDRQYDRFYEHWTMKESVIKAEGRGLSIPLTDIRLHRGKAAVYDTVWFLRELMLDVRYKCYLAANSEQPEFEIREVRL